MLGRWQPWHQGHRALFERAIAKTGQVAIMVRDCHDDKNPFLLKEVTERIYKDLDSLYNNRYIVYPVPNIVNITYGRDVGYKIEQEHFDESITSISATKIRKEMGL
jgi:nicotinamide mononucleotide adenylyltransferase